MDQVKIRAEIAAHGMPKGAVVTVAETPLVAGAIGGVFTLIERFPEKVPESADEQTNAPGFEPTDPDGPVGLEDVELPDVADGPESGNELAENLIAPPEEDQDLPEKQRGRGRG